MATLVHKAKGHESGSYERDFSGEFRHSEQPGLSIGYLVQINVAVQTRLFIEVFLRDRSLDEQELTLSHQKETSFLCCYTQLYLALMTSLHVLSTLVIKNNGDSPQQFYSLYLIRDHSCNIKLCLRDHMANRLYQHLHCSGFEFVSFIGQKMLINFYFTSCKTNYRFILITFNRDTGS